MDLLQYAIELSNRNHAPVQLFMPWWPYGERLDVYEIPADCQAHREAHFTADQDYPRDAPP